MEFMKALLANKIWRAIFIFIGFIIVANIVVIFYDVFNKKARELRAKLRANEKAYAKERERKEREFNEWRRKEEEDKKKSVKGSPEERYEIAKKWHNERRYSEAYSVFNSLVGKYDNAEMLARMDFREWYETVRGRRNSVVGSLEDYIDTKVIKLGIMEVRYKEYTEEVKRIINILVKDHNEKQILVKDQKEYEQWLKEAKELYDSAYKQLMEINKDYAVAKAEKEATDRRERMEEAMREMEELGYDSDSSSSGTYDSVDLGMLPNMMYFVNDPDTVYQHYAYMTGGMGQKVRVYMSLSGDRKISISYARNGMQVGRDYYTDQGTITKYL